MFCLASSRLMRSANNCPVHVPGESSKLFNCFIPVPHAAVSQRFFSCDASFFKVRHKRLQHQTHRNSSFFLYLGLWGFVSDTCERTLNFFWSLNQCYRCMSLLTKWNFTTALWLWFSTSQNPEKLASSIRQRPTNPCQQHICDAQENRKDHPCVEVISDSWQKRFVQAF